MAVVVAPLGFAIGYLLQGGLLAVLLVGFAALAVFAVTIIWFLACVFTLRDVR